MTKPLSLSGFFCTRPLKTKQWGFFKTFSFIWLQQDFVRVIIGVPISVWREHLVERPLTTLQSQICFAGFFLLLQKGKQCCFMLWIIIFGRFGHFGGISSLLLFTEKVLNPFFVFFLSFLASIFTFFCIGFSVLTNMKAVSVFALVYIQFSVKAKKNVPKKRKYKLKLTQLWSFKTTVW